MIGSVVFAELNGAPNTNTGRRRDTSDMERATFVAIARIAIMQGWRCVQKGPRL